MTGYVEQLVEALRNELQQYGEMLALLDVQDSAGGGLPAILNACESIQRQGTAIEEARLLRLQQQSRLAWVIGQAEKDSVVELLPELPPHYQPLLGALIAEINGLVGQVREKAMHCHTRLDAAARQLERLMTTMAEYAPTPTPGAHPIQPVTA
jgi:hypothetical protein